MRRLRRLLLFIGIVCGLCAIFYCGFIAPEVNEMMRCINTPETNVTHLAWSEDSQYILVRMETDTQILSVIVQTFVISVTSDEEVVTNFVGDTDREFGVNFRWDESVARGMLPLPVHSPDQQQWASLRLDGHDLNVYIRSNHESNEQLLYRLVDKCFEVIKN